MHLFVCMLKCYHSYLLLQRFVVLAPEDVSHQNKTAFHLIWQWSAKQRRSLERRLHKRGRAMMLRCCSRYRSWQTISSFKSSAYGWSLTFNRNDDRRWRNYERCLRSCPTLTGRLSVTTTRPQWTLWLPSFHVPCVLVAIPACSRCTWPGRCHHCDWNEDQRASCVVSAYFRWKFLICIKPCW